MVLCLTRSPGLLEETNLAMAFYLAWKQCECSTDTAIKHEKCALILVQPGGKSHHRMDQP